ncbi:MAG: hypothetical protein ACC663_05540, partial [Gammaproteobacteria bacterium]
PATEQFRNIATAISGGLITSTMMTLVVIPVAYMLMDDLVAFIRRIYMDDRTSEIDSARGQALPVDGEEAMSDRNSHEEIETTRVTPSTLVAPSDPTER